MNLYMLVAPKCLGQHPMTLHFCAYERNSCQKLRLSRSLTMFITMRFLELELDWFIASAVHVSLWPNSLLTGLVSDEGTYAAIQTSFYRE
jgi:hypothetical protein